MKMTEAEVQAALYAEAAKFYEMARETIRIYTVDTGSGAPVFPPWEELSSESQDVVYDFVGEVVGTFLPVAGLMMPEVDIDSLPG